MPADSGEIHTGADERITSIDDDGAELSFVDLNVDVKVENELTSVSLEQIHYVYKSEPSFQETRALFIANLKPSYDIDLFKQILLEEAQKVNCTIERAWLNSRRSHCYLLASDTPGATAIRDKLNGYIFPVDEPMKEAGDGENQLYVDYIPVRAIITWIDQEKDGPSDAIWKLTYEDVPSVKNIGTTFKRVTHTMVNYPNTHSGYIGLRRNAYKHESSNDLFKPRSKRESGRRSKNITSHRRRERSDTYIPRYSDDINNSSSSSASSRNGSRRRRSRLLSDTYIPSY
jgi:hypothetical protein